MKTEYVNKSEAFELIVAAALYDFGGYLTSRKERIVASTSDNAAPMAEAIKEFCEMRGINPSQEIPVLSWQEWIAPSQEAEPVGFEYSRDYGALWEFICAGGNALGFVDYRFPDETEGSNPWRDPVQIQRTAPYQIMIAARGISYGDIHPFRQDKWPDEKELFLKTCANINLEWAKPVAAQPPAVNVPSHPNGIYDGTACDHDDNFRAMASKWMAGNLPEAQYSHLISLLWSEYVTICNAAQPPSEAVQEQPAPIATSERLPASDEILCAIWVPERDDWEFGFWVDGAGCWDCPDHGFIPGKKVSHYVELPHEQRMPKATRPQNPEVAG